MMNFEIFSTLNMVFVMYQFVEIGEAGVCRGVTEVGLEYLENALKTVGV